MKSMILYVVDPLYNKTIRFNTNEYTPLIFDDHSSQNILIRYELVDGDVEEALDIAKPREYEIVLNAVLIEDSNNVDVKIQYFKPSGKYYSEGTIKMSPDMRVDQASDEIKGLFRKGIAPGLTGYEPTFNAYISFSNLTNGYPVLLQMGQYHE